MAGGAGDGAEGARLRILDPATGEDVSLDEVAPVDFGTVTAGGQGEPRRLVVRNDGEAEVYFAKLRAVQHPTGQVGGLADTVKATEFALREDGAYAAEVELGTLAPGEERSVWVRWAVPAEAPAGTVVWALEAMGAVT